MDLISRIYQWMSGQEQEYQGTCRRMNTESAVFRRRVPCDSVELFHDGRGKIRHVRIGSWRVIAASGSREIAEVRELPSCKRLAVRIELYDGSSLAPSCTIWELYNLQGNLLAMLQSTPVPEYWLATDFQTGRVWQSNAESLIGLSA